MTAADLIVEGDDCDCGGRNDCHYCGGSEWLYRTYAPCDGCGLLVCIRESARPMLSGLGDLAAGLGRVCCDDCAEGA